MTAAISTLPIAGCRCKGSNGERAAIVYWLDLRIDDFSGVD